MTLGELMSEPLYVTFLSGVTSTRSKTFRRVASSPLDYAYVANERGTPVLVAQCRGDEDSTVLARFVRGQWEVPGLGKFEEARFSRTKPR